MLQLEFVLAGLLCCAILVDILVSFSRMYFHVAFCLCKIRQIDLISLCLYGHSLLIEELVALSFLRTNLDIRNSYKYIYFLACFPAFIDISCFGFTPGTHTVVVP